MSDSVTKSTEKRNTDGPILQAKHVYKTYRLGRVDVPVLRDASIGVKQGEWVAILGASGSGKSTLMHLLGGLDRPDKGRDKNGGSVVFQGRDLAKMSARELDRYRARSVGFVFQSYHLLPELNVLENVLSGAMVRYGRLGYTARKSMLRERGKGLLEAMGLAHRQKHRPVELSGGERQRVAIARSLINQPDVLLADEPTGNLDTKTGQSILDAIERLRVRDGDSDGQRQTIVMVTHSREVANRADRLVELTDGRVRSRAEAATAS